MTQLDVALFLLALLAYGAATVLYEAYFIVSTWAYGRWASTCAAAGFGLQGLAMLARWNASGYPPFSNAFEVVSLYAWLVVLVYLVVERVYGHVVMGAIVVPVAFTAIIVASVLPKDIQPLVPILQSQWLAIHVTISFAAYSVFTLAFASGAFYLLQERALKAKRPSRLLYRLPPLHTMERVQHLLIAIGFPLISLTLVSGALWADVAWGAFWSWDAKEVATLLTWGIYAAFLHARNVGGWSGHRTSILAIAGFAAVLITFFGVRVLAQSLHTF